MQRRRDAEMQRNWSGREELLLLKFHSGCGLMAGLGPWAGRSSTRKLECAAALSACLGDSSTVQIPHPPKVVCQLVDVDVNRI